MLSVDENREQTRAIHQFQRRRQTLAGLLADQDRKETLALHRNAQRLLRPLLVANPFAESLDVPGRQDPHAPGPPEIPDADSGRRPAAPVPAARSRRPCITSRPVEYIEVTLDDIAVANRLACEVLGRSVDELPPQTRRLLGLVDEMVTAACRRQGIDRADHRFSRRDIREYTGWGHTQLKVHLKRLEELEYLLVHRGGRGQSFVYELLYDPPPDAQDKFLARLIDVEQLRAAVRRKLVGAATARSRAVVGAKSGPSRAEVGPEKSPQVPTAQALCRRRARK